MRAGRLRHRLVIQRFVGAPDDMGGQASSASDWEEVATVPASIEPLRGREALLAQQVQAETTHKIVIRWRTGLDCSMRGVFGGRYFNFRELRTVREVQHFIEIMADEGGQA